MGDNTCKVVEIARSEGRARYFTGLPCKRGHVSERYTRTQNCVECKNAASREFAKKNHAVVAGRLRKWRGEHRKEYADGRRGYLAKTRGRVNELVRKRRRENPADARAKVMARLAGKKCRTPPWANADAILSFYVEAERLSRETGVQHEVDHIIPLFGKIVSGLHVETNLQVLTRSANASKGNRFP